MTDLEHAIVRITAWVRDYGDKYKKVFIGDVSILLLAAQDSIRQQAELTAKDERIAELEAQTRLKFNHIGPMKPMPYDLEPDLDD